MDDNDDNDERVPSPLSLPSSSPCVVASCRRVMSSLCRSCHDSSFCRSCRRCHAAVASPRRLVIAVYCVASRRLPLHVSLLVILSSSAVSSLPSIASPLHVSLCRSCCRRELVVVKPRHRRLASPISSSPSLVFTSLSHRHRPPPHYFWLVVVFVIVPPPPTSPGAASVKLQPTAL